MSSWKELLGEKLMKDHKGDSVDTEEALKDLDAVGLYFSAHWCPPCKGFTPVLAQKYQQLKEAGKKFEVVFLSSDKTEQAYSEYFKEMPWLSLNFSDRGTKENLSKKYGCRGIPYLVILDGKTQEVITTNGRAGVSGEKFIEEFPWYPKPAYDISESMDGIEENYSQIVIQDFADQAVKDANSALVLALAKEAKEKKDESKVKCYFTANGGGPVGFVRQQCGLVSENPDDNQKQPKMMVLDVKNRSYYKPLDESSEVNEANLRKLLDDFKADKLTSTKMGSN